MGVGARKASRGRKIAAGSSAGGGSRSEGAVALRRLGGELARAGCFGRLDRLRGKNVAAETRGSVGGRGLTLGATGATGGENEHQQGKKARHRTWEPG
jgi:hypothetical protein